MAFILSLWVKVQFWPKNANFLQKYADISKINKALVLKSIFSETRYACVIIHTHQMIQRQFLQIFKNAWAYSVKSIGFGGFLTLVTISGQQVLH